MTSSGWTRQHRCEYRQTTVQEPWGATRVSNKVSKITSRHLVPLDRAFPAHALVHESELYPHRSRSTVLSPTDAVRHWPATHSHLIQDVAREVDLSPPPCRTARSKAVSDDRRVPEERVLHAGLPMIARGLLPASPSDLLDRQDRAITSARPRSVSRHVGRTRRRNHDGGVTRTGGFVKADRLVGGIRRHLSEGAVDRLRSA